MMEYKNPAYPRATQRLQHANPIVEHLFQRFEAGAPLIQIAHEITGIQYRPPGSRTANDRGDEAWDFMRALVMATIAPGTEYLDDPHGHRRDLGERQDGASMPAGGLHP